MTTEVVLIGSQELRGWIFVECPVDSCKHKKKFPETDRTVNDAETRLRRLRYLRLCHEAGRHK